MNKAVKKKWLKALRSGEYKQGKGRLVRVEPDGAHSFCCLGVLCDILPAEQVDWEVHNDVVLATVGGNAVSDSYVPSAVWWRISPWDGQKHLASLNDTGLSFKAIADWIEKNL